MEAPSAGNSLLDFVSMMPLFAQITFWSCLAVGSAALFIQRIWRGYRRGIDDQFQPRRYEMPKEENLADVIISMRNTLDSFRQQLEARINIEANRITFEAQRSQTAYEFLRENHDELKAGLTEVQSSVSAVATTLAELKEKL